MMARRSMWFVLRWCTRMKAGGVRVVIMLGALVCLLLPLHYAYAQETAMQEEAEHPAAPRAVRYGVTDMKDVALDATHPLADIVAEMINRRMPMSCIWAEIAGHYAEQGYHADAWRIQKAMLAKVVSGEVLLPDEALERVLKGMTALPARYQKWEDLEVELFSLFEGRQTSRRASEALGRLTATFDKIGEKNKALSFVKRFIAAYPDDTLGVKALNFMPATAVLYQDIAGAKKGTRAGAAAQLKLAETLARQNKTAKAVWAYKEYLQLYPNGFEVPTVIRTLTKLYEQTRDFKGAIEYSRKLLKHLAGTDAIAVAVRMARLYHRLGNRKEYVTVYLVIGDKYGVWYPTDAARSILNGAEHAHNNKWVREAAELYDACIQVVARANALPLGDLPRSKAGAQERLAFWKACLNVRSDAQETITPAIAKFAKKFSRSREAAYAQCVLSQLALEAGRIQEALEHAEALLGLLPNAPAARRLAADVRAKADSLGYAHRETRTARNSLGRLDVRGLEGAEAVYKLAHFHAKSGRLDEAIQNFQALVSEWPKSTLAPRALFDVAVLYRDGLKNRRRMRAALERVLVLYPETELGITAFQLLNKTKETK